MSPRRCRAYAWLPRSWRVTGKRQRPFGEGVRLLQVASQQLGLTQGETDRAPDNVPWLVAVACSIACVSNGMASARRPHSVYAAPKAAAISGSRAGEVHFLTDAHGLFEQREGSGQVALTEGQQTKSVIGTHQAPGVRHRLGNLERFFPEGMALSEQAELSMARRRARPGRARRAGWEAQNARGVVFL